jgi:glucose-1-phosphatase
MKINTIFFDLGNVLVKFDLDIFKNKIIENAKCSYPSLSEFTSFKYSGKKYMEGKISSSQFYNFAKRKLKFNLKYHDFYDAWNSIFYPYPEMEDIVRTIRSKYPQINLVLVSDTNEAHFDFIKQQYDIVALFDHHVLSYKVGKIKPNPEMYNTALKLSGTMAKEVFYADDRVDFIKAARSMGLRAFPFTEHKTLRTQLAKFDIII